MCICNLLDKARLKNLGYGMEDFLIFCCIVLMWALAIRVGIAAYMGTFDLFGTLYGTI